MKPFIIHHHDLDGYTAGAVAKIAYPEAGSRSMNYDDPTTYPGPEFFVDYDPVIIVDYTLPAETMLWLKSNRHLIWIDHHYSSVMQSRAMGYDDVDGLRYNPGELICGAELCWKFFQKKPIPHFLKLVGDFDTFRNSKAPEFQSQVLPFFYATQLVFDRMKPANSENADYLLKTPECFENETWCQELIDQGLIIQAFNRQYYGNLLKESAFVRNIWGIRVLCFNCAGHGSANMQPAFDPEKHDAMLLFSFNGKRWTYGIYSDLDLKPNVDCSAIAKAHGGGGHRAAAGFSTEKLLPELA